MSVKHQDLKVFALKLIKFESFPFTWIAVARHNNLRGFILSFSVLKTLRVIHV